MICKLLTNEGYGYKLCRALWTLDAEVAPFHRFYYVVGGHAHYKSDTQNVEIVPGYLYVLPSFSRYSVWNDPDHRAELFYVHIEIVPDFTDGLLQIPIGKDTLEYSLLHTMRLFGDIGDLENLGDLCPILVRRIVDIQNPTIVPRIVNDPRLDHVIRYIEHHKEKKITIKNLAQVACMERGYFTRMFTKNYKVPPLKYVTRRKMALAAQELMSGVHVDDIAQKIGYEDGTAFSRTFKRVYGISPAEYKKSHNL
jgi:AraC-like DNA-binding protein